MASTQTEDGGLGPPVKGVNLVFLWVISTVFSLQGNFCFCIRRVLTSLNDGGEVRLSSFSINQTKICLQVIEHGLVLLSSVLIWSFCGSYPLFFSLQANFCFCVRRVLTSVYEVERCGWDHFQYTNQRFLYR